MNKKAIIIISIAVTLLVVVSIGIGLFFFVKSKENNDEDKKLEWGEIYLEILEDEKKLEDIDDTKIQLLDLDKDSIPELVIYGIDSTKQHIANIYKINEKNKVDTVKVSLEDEFELRLLYDFDEDDYVWYAVAKNSKATTHTTPSNTNSSQDESEYKVYNLNIETKKYEPELLNKNYTTDFVEVGGNYSEKIDFDKKAKKSEKKNVFEKAKENYIENEKLITDEVKSKVENAKMIKKIKKVDSSKDIVYTVREIKTENEIYAYPAINLDSKEIEEINNDIKKKYGFYNLNEIMENSFGECEEIGYKYFINKKYLSLLVYTGGNSSLWCEIYNIDLDTLKKVENSTIIDEYKLDSSEIKTKAVEAANKKFEEVKNGEKSLWVITPTYESEYSKWKSELDESIKKLDNIYIDEDGKVCMLAKIQHFGGQYSCTKTIIINLSDYSIKEFEYAKIISSKKETNQSVAKQPATNQTPSVTTNTTKTEDKSSNNDKPTTPNAISSDEAIKLAQKVFGTKDSESGYEIGYSYACWVKDQEGKEYYIVNMRWFNGTNWSWIGAVCVAVDGKSYKQLDMPPSFENGDTVTNMIGGENF